MGVTAKMVRDYAIKLGYEINAETPLENFINDKFIDPTPEREPNIFETIREQREEAFWKEQEIEEIQQEIQTESKATLNKVNENIEWAAWSFDEFLGYPHAYVESKPDIAPVGANHAGLYSPV